MKKAATLTPYVVERIAVLKRCGLYNPADEPIAAPSAAITPDTGTGAATPASGSAAAPLEPTAAAAEERDSDVASVG